MTAGPKDSLVEHERDVVGQESTLPLYPEQPQATAARYAAFLTLWRKRGIVLKAGLAGLVIAGLVAFLIPPKYESTTRLMPLDSSSNSAMALAMLAGKGGEGLSSLAAELGGLKTTGALFIGILRSRTLEDRLIDSFQLRKVYRVNLQRDARESLAASTEIAEDRKSGIISLTVTDKSPQRAQALANAYVEELNRLNAGLSTTAAHREREFLEERLQTVKTELDAASKEFSAFSSQTSILDISEQGKAMVTAAASLEGELIASEAQLGALRQIYTDNNYRVRALRGRIAELRRQIDKLRGGANAGTPQDSSAGGGELPNIRQLPALGVSYYGLLRRVKIQEAVYEALTKQYELAKVAEAKETPIVKVLDPANLPEKKSSPHRLLMMLAGLCLGFVISSVYVVGSARWSERDADHPANLIGQRVRQGLVDDYTHLSAAVRQVRSRIKDRISRNAHDAAQDACEKQTRDEESAGSAMNASSSKSEQFSSDNAADAFRAETLLLCVVAACTAVVLLTPFVWWLWALGGMAGLCILFYVGVRVLNGQMDFLVLGWVLLFPLGYFALSFPREKPIITLDRLEAGLLLLAAFFAPRVARTRLPIAIRRAALAWALFFAAACLSLLKVGSQPALMSSARIIVDSFALPAIVAGCILALFPVSRHLKRLHVLTCIVAAYLAAIGIAEIVTGEDLLPLPGAGLYYAGENNLFLRMNGPFLSNNSYALVGLLTLWFLAFLRWTLRDAALPRWQKLLHKIGIMGALVCACLPLFRSVFLTLAVIFLLEAWLDRRRWHGVARLAALVAVASLFLGVRYLVPELYAERVSSGENVYARLAQQKQNLDVFLHNPVLGVGIGNFNQAAPKLTVYSGLFGGVDPLDYPHNNLAAILAETGVLGFIPYVVANAFLVLAFWDLSKRCDKIGPALWKYFVFLFLSYWISGLTLTSGYFWDLNMWYLFTLAILYRYGLTAIPRHSAVAV